MATKKVYPFINAEMFDLEGNNDRKNVTFDAREVESYESWSSKDDEDENECVQVNFKSGRKMCLYMELDQELYPATILLLQSTWCITLTSGTITKTLPRTRTRSNNTRKTF